MPLAGGFISDEKDIYHEKYFPLSVHVCVNCGLVQILNPVDPNILFQDYSFSSSTVVPLVRHFENYASWLKKHYNPKKLFEFGCNDGILYALYPLPLGQLKFKFISHSKQN